MHSSQLQLLLEVGACRELGELVVFDVPPGIRYANFDGSLVLLVAPDSYLRFSPPTREGYIARMFYVRAPLTEKDNRYLRARHPEETHIYHFGHMNHRQRRALWDGNDIVRCVQRFRNRMGFRVPTKQHKK